LHPEILTPGFLHFGFGQRTVP